MKKRGFLIYLILGFLFFPSFAFARNYSGVATTARSAVLDTSSNYYYTNWIVLQSNSLNSVPIPYGGGNYYHMGAEYVMPLSLNGESQFEAYVRVPVVSNTIYNYQLMNGLNFDDFKIGFSGTFGVYNVSSFLDWDSSWECQTYPHLGIAHNYCYYDIYVKFNMTPITGGTNMNFAVFNTNASHSSYYYTGYDSNGNAIEFPVASQNSGYPTLSPTVRLVGSGGDSGGTTDNSDITNSIDENSQLIIDSLTDNSEQIIEQINENYQNLVNSQQVCSNYNLNSSNTDFITGKQLISSGQILNNSVNSITDYIPISKDMNYNLYLYTTIMYSPSYCLYDKNYEQISCENYNGRSNISIHSTSDGFIRFTVYNDYKQYYSFTGPYCKNGNQAISDSILDDSHASPNSFFDDMESLQLSDTPITDLLTMPLTLARAFYNGISGQCSTINLGTWYDTPMLIPCFNIENYLGSNLWNIIDLLFSGFMIFNIGQLMIHDFDSITSLEDLFDETYTPRHEKLRRSK